MATTDSIKNALAEKKSGMVAAKNNSVKGLLDNPVIQNKFKEILKDKSAQFTSSLLTLVNNDAYLADSQPMSIIAGAMQAAQLDLPLEKQFGFAYLVPFNEKDKVTGQWVKKAQFVLGYKGYVQLAQRSGQYKHINVGTVYEGQLKSWNPLTEELVLDFEAQESEVAIGYFGYFELLNGFKKSVYWTKEQMERHRIRNNKAKDKAKLTNVWASDYDAMAQKTVLRNMISKWGILSIEYQKGVVNDEQVLEDFDDNGNGIFKDVTPEEIAEAEVIEAPFDPAEAINHIEVDEATGEIIGEQEELFPTKVKSKL
ncbi:MULTISPECIES: recombinase RecT [unclassified Facklamia]|uniref:recombinase RecT n=1 Tax=Aerococcaceae TaxID=186827 RepID=UPI0013BC9DE0|nr:MULTISPECIES: recombinase RecT [unclassified Facklamia]NEW64281.1 recombinase RecT [Facklamia sp. 252]NEW67882.1 recombinase RecT [Facklamia sp. 253]QQD64747.1 recombinase RecT [Aerococcaceae bacterium zg-252]